MVPETSCIAEDVGSEGQCCHDTPCTLPSTPASYLPIRYDPSSRTSLESRDASCIIPRDHHSAQKVWALYTCAIFVAFPKGSMSCVESGEAHTYAVEAGAPLLPGNFCQCIANRTLSPQLPRGKPCMFQLAKPPGVTLGPSFTLET